MKQHSQVASDCSNNYPAGGHDAIIVCRQARRGPDVRNLERLRQQDLMTDMTAIAASAERVSETSAT